MDDPRINTLLAIRIDGAPTNDHRWLAIEESLGLALPDSYKTLVELFGASNWREFLSVLSPFDERLNLEQRAADILDADRTTRHKFPADYPLPLYPEPGGLLPWAITDNGDTFYFITSGHPNHWPTVIKGPRAPEFEVSFLPPHLLLHHFAVGSLRSSILPTF